MAAIYCGDVYCDDCTDLICRDIAKELWLNAPALDGYGGLRCPDGSDPDDHADIHVLSDYLDRMDETTYDSHDYPKNCDDNEESDSPQHCGNHEDCVNHGTLPDGYRYGYCFGNDLTTHGQDYVREAVRNGEPDGVARLVWAEVYDYLELEIV